MSIQTDPTLSPREHSILIALVHMHGEFGLDNDFTHDAIRHILGEACAGTLATLTVKGYVLQRNTPAAVKGYVLQRNTPAGIGYRVTERGYAKFAGIEEVPDPGHAL